MATAGGRAPAMTSCRVIHAEKSNVFQGKVNDFLKRNEIKRLWSSFQVSEKGFTLLIFYDDVKAAGRA